MSKLLDFVQKNGRAPQVQLLITPLDKTKEQIILDQFLTYSFNSSIMVPVDVFQFSFTMPNVSGAINQFIQEGDIAELTAADSLLCTGIIDVVSIETTKDGGDVVHITGRNLLGQLEDQSAVNTLDKPIFGKSVPVETVAGTVIQNTRIRGLLKQDAPAGTFLFATEPGESKMSALQRFVEPLNCIIWSDGSGNLVIGRPDMAQDTSGDIICDRDGRFSNILSIKADRASTQIPNIIIPIWSGQETVQHRVAPEQAVFNTAEGPKRLRQANHNVQKCVVVSTPSGSDPQSLSDVNAIKVGGSNLLQAYALREIARANVGELVVHASVKSHYNDDMEPFIIDQVYNVNYSRAGIQEKMYLYEVDYTMDVESGPRTMLSFCRLGRIVAGVSIASVIKKLQFSGKLPVL